jgi:hypothetical protein
MYIPEPKAPKMRYKTRKGLKTTTEKRGGQLARGGSTANFTSRTNKKTTKIV